MTAAPVPDDLQRLLAEEPFVRRLAQRLVADDADDVVQQAWLRVLAARPSLLREPRRWLASVVRHLATDRRRRRGRRREHEAEAAHERLVPSSCELLEAEERRRELVDAVDALPGSSRTIVLLRFYEGLPPRRIAARLGLPVTTVSNRLHAALQELRHTLDRRHGERRAWLLPLVPFAASPRAMPWREVLSPVAAGAAGAIAMKTKLVLAAAAVLAVALWTTWPDPERATVDIASSPQGPDLATASVPASGVTDGGTDQHGLREAVASALPIAATAAAGGGTVVVRVRYSEEPRAAANVMVELREYDPLTRGARRWNAFTDASGLVRFDGLPEDTYSAYAPVRPEVMAHAQVMPARTSELELELTQGMTLRGTVVDAAGVPVGGALLEMSLPSFGTTFGAVGVAAADGTFALRGCPTTLVIGARAARHAASPLHHVHGKPGSTEQLRIELRDGGGTVAGVVVGPDGTPVVGAVVKVGDGVTEGLHVGEGGGPPLPALAYTGANGRFEALGLRPGPQTMQALAPGLAPWRGTCEVADAGVTMVRIVLQPGLTCRGTVVDGDRRPLADVTVRLTVADPFVRLAARTGADGAFVLEGLPAGDSKLYGWHQRAGVGSVAIRGNAGETVAAQLVLDSGLVLTGRVVDDAGAPVAGVQVDLEARNAPRDWMPFAFTDDDGRFRLVRCPPGQSLVARISSRDHMPFVREGVDPRAGEIELRLQRDTRPRATITGRLLLPDGAPAAKETVRADRTDARMVGEEAIVGADGTFTLTVRAGTWGLAASVSGLPGLRVEPRELRPGEVWNVGELRAVRGGTLAVDTNGVTGARCSISDANGRYVAGLPSGQQTLQSQPLAPGSYLLLVRGAAVAARALPFAIRADEQTALTLEPATGVRQRFEVTTAGGTELPRSAQLRIERDGRLVASVTAEPPAAVGGVVADRLEASVWLEPGAYTLRVLGPPALGQEVFTVGVTEAEAVRATLR